MIAERSTTGTGNQKADAGEEVFDHGVARLHADIFHDIGISPWGKQAFERQKPDCVDSNTILVTHIDMMGLASRPARMPTTRERITVIRRIVWK